ncbi:MAG: glutamate-5-semialdehyde dehydrogenase [Bacillota bacterium]
MHPEVIEKCKKARKAALKMRSLSTNKKNQFLVDLADALTGQADKLINANKEDLENLEKKNGFSEAFHDRLLLTTARIGDMSTGLRDIAALEEPVGEVVKMWTRPNGLQIGLQRVPIGVIGIIYEARPNVTIDAAGLALKAGNAVILRGSSEAIQSNKAMVDIIHQVLGGHDLDRGAVSLIEDTERVAVNDLIKAKDYLDLVIPRGGTSLIDTVVENATVPVIQTGEGNCHIYIDEYADLEMALQVVLNAKTQRPGVCNAVETVLVHEKTAGRFIPALLASLSEAGVEIRGCSRTAEYAAHIPVIPAGEDDWQTEYLALILAVKVVSDLGEAVNHIGNYGTGHSEAIITESYSRSREFTDRVDSAAVYVNASTRFTDGYEFGLGAEMGISTQKLHVRGPMGLEALTSLKYVIFGSGQTRP